MQAREGEWETVLAWRCHEGYSVGGDYCWSRADGNSLVVALVDVLGHGQAANESLQGIISALNTTSATGLLSLYSLIERTASLRRGCALFLGQIGSSNLDYILVGNTRAWVLTPSRTEFLLGQPGVVGHSRTSSQAKIQKAALPARAIILACSDGIRRSFVPEHGQSAYWFSDGQQLIEHILSTYSVQEDDASVLFVRRV